jgi:hypothetical protein
MSTLIEISEDLFALRDLIENADDELSPGIENALEAWFAEVGQARDEKLDGYAALIRHLTLRAAARREEKERLDKRVAVDENAAKRLKDRLKMFFEVQGLKKVETRRYRISVQANGGKQAIEVSVPPQDLLPHYQIVKYEADTDAIRTAWERGNGPAGTRLVPRGTHLRIA